MENKMSLRFSVIMCVYNLEKIVNTAIESVLNQTYKNYELIIVNDGSKDDTIKILKKFEKKANGKIKIIDNSKNIGLSSSRNIAIEEAKGEYILHLDGDDTFYDKYTLQKIDETIGDKKIDICYFGVQYVGGGNKLYLPNAENSTKKARIVCDMHFAVSSKVWRREFLKENNIVFIEDMYYEDMVYSIKAVIKAKELSFGSFPIYVYYRNREGSIMSTANIKRCKDMYKMLYYLTELYEETPEDLKPYLISFIKNETYGVPARLDSIIRSMNDSTYTPVFPKRNYVFTEEFPTIIENNSKIIPIEISNKIDYDKINKKIDIPINKYDVEVADSKDELKIEKFEN